MELEQQQGVKGISLKVSSSYVGRIRASSESVGRFIWAHHGHSKFPSFFWRVYFAACT